MAREQSTHDWLLLSLIPGVSTRTLMKLSTMYASPKEILAVLVTEWRHLPLHKTARQWLAEHGHQIEQALSPVLTQTDRWQQQGGVILDWHSSAYPTLLKEIYDPPVVLYTLGRTELLQASSAIAVVGSRKATTYGVAMAEQFGYQFAEQGWQVISGLALGVDGAAHQGALNAHQRLQAGSTIAVVATGLDQVYPSAHKRLHEAICNEGCVVSEYALGVVPRANFFPRRNRIISGLSRGIVVVEASQKSGSLVSARCALEQNRDVFAIPGNVTNPQAEGCHLLIQQGAKLATSANDVLQELEYPVFERQTQATGEAQPVSLENRATAIAKEPQQLVLSQEKAFHESDVAVGDPIRSDPVQDDHCRDDSVQSDPIQEDPLLMVMGVEVCTADELIVKTGMSWAELSQKLLMLELTGKIRSTQGGYQRSLDQRNTDRSFSE